MTTPVSANSTPLLSETDISKYLRLIMLSGNAANVVYNADLPVSQIPTGQQAVSAGYVLDSQPDFTITAGIAQPYPSEPGWVAAGVAIDGPTGGKAIVFHNQTTNEVMVTFAGMDGISNGADQGSGIVYNATNQSTALRPQLNAILNGLYADSTAKER